MISGTGVGHVGDGFRSGFGDEEKRARNQRWLVGRGAVCLIDP